MCVCEREGSIKVESGGLRERRECGESGERDRGREERVAETRGR